MNEIKEMPTHIIYYVIFVRHVSPTGSYWGYGTMADTKEQAAQYGAYYDEFKVFQVKLPI